jgi:hypothetical protein
VKHIEEDISSAVYRGYLEIHYRPNVCTVHIEKSVLVLIESNDRPNVCLVHKRIVYAGIN